MRRWVHTWVRERELPVSQCGLHIKLYTLLSDPAIASELRSYVRSEKWAMDLKKLQSFSQRKLVPEAAKKYLHEILTQEIPKGLKSYLEVKLFSRIHYRVGSQSICLRTAQRWLHQQGFQYTEHKKALYYDSHEREDVVKYRQDVFLPAIARYRC